MGRLGKTTCNAVLFAAAVNGMGRLTYPRFQAFDVFGGAFWISSLTLAGYWFGNLPWIRNNLSLVIVAIVLLSLLPALIGWLRHRR